MGPYEAQIFGTRLRSQNGTSLMFIKLWIRFPLSAAADVKSFRGQLTDLWAAPLSTAAGYFSPNPHTWSQKLGHILARVQDFDVTAGEDVS